MTSKRKVSDNSMPSKRTKGPIEFLPNEIVVDLIKYLRNVDRVNFGLTCTRFHNIDIKIGRRFTEIYINLISGLIRAKDEHDAFYWTSNKGEDDSIRRARLANAGMVLKNACTKRLEVDYVSTADAEEISKESITILDTLKFNKFIFDGKDCEELIPRMFTIVNWSECEKVRLKWAVSETNQICPLREALLLLPKIKKIKLEFGFSRRAFDARRLRPENALLEAESLAHIVRNFDNAHLPLVNCHPEDILRSFEICCDSDCPDKCIIFSMHHFYAQKFSEYIRERGASEDASATYLLERGTILHVAKIDPRIFWTTVVIRKETYRQNQLSI